MILESGKYYEVKKRDGTLCCSGKAYDYEYEEIFIECDLEGRESEVFFFKYRDSSLSNSDFFFEELI